MFYKEVAKGVYSVGVLNPGLRIFDIVMPTAYGTSYNAYLVKGNDKVVLIETVHKDYLDGLLENLKAITGDIKIDYLIMNHNEPDHSGAIAELLKVMPELKIYVSRAGMGYLKNITNRTDLNVEAVADGQTLDLGGKTLRFINAPFLHWPDSMFTYLEEENVLFSCDYLGSHYCEPQVLDTAITNLPAFEEAFWGYYAAIFGPFKPYVLKGYDKIKDLDIAMACPSHGPVLTRGGKLEYALEQYIAWSTPKVRNHKLIPVFYCSAYGNTEQLAKQIAKGILSVLPDAEVECYNIIEHDMAVLGGLLNECDAAAIGSPTINRDAVPPVYQLLAHVDAINFAKRPIAVFGSYGWSGEAQAGIKARLQTLKASLFEEDCRVVFVPSDNDLELAEEFGERFAQTIA